MEYTDDLKAHQREVERECPSGGVIRKAMGKDLE